MRDNSSDNTSSRTLPAITSTHHTSTHTPSSTRGTMTPHLSPKKVARFALVTCLLVTVAIVYVTLFKHPPPDQLMKMNSAGAKDFNLRSFGSVAKSHAEARPRRENAADDQNGDQEEEKEEDIVNWFDDDKDEDNDKDEEVHEEGDNPKFKPVMKTVVRMDKKETGGEMKGKAAWDKFIADNHHTVIGIVYDKCEDPTEQLGTVVLLPDKENGGVKSRTFYNFTLDRVIDEGWTFNIEVKYNGQDLYDNWWEVCEMEDDLDTKEKTFVCPVQPGRLNLVKDKHIPGYIPTGRYLSKAWVKDSNNTILLCGYSDMRL